MRTILWAAMLVLALQASASAQSLPPWHRVGDDIVVERTARNNGFPYAVVHDRAMRAHNTYCIAIGAHIAGRVVVAIRTDGVVLSDGRILFSQAPQTGSALASVPGP